MARSKEIAARRPDYLAELAHGTERFHLSRRVECPWCASPRLRERLSTTDLVQLKPGRFVLDQCRNCGHIFQNPQLSQEGLDFYYRDFYDGLGEETTAKLFQGRGSTKRFRTSARAMLRVARSDRWLDVGTSHGHFCQAARKVLPTTVFDGLDNCEGVECAAAEGRISHAYRGFFVDLVDEMAGRYDVVSMFHYLEHTPDPKKELAAARTALRPGGHLMIEVPDPESIYGRLLGKWWVPWLQPQHLHLIPVANLCQELSTHGFTVMAVDRREPHIPVDLTVAAWFRLTRVLPPDDAPWLPERPRFASRLTRVLLVLAAAPFLIAACAADQLLAPLVRRTRLSNAYRVIARRD
ncbi:class I SAM-dependent methyltransferase [Streptomyces sp. NPDC006283]|uniref:class I SAM-dependent methyltransferase n=1 Tax=Streptomyces sp. NPDC006283 TaxID=3156741 RepID=UPI0033ADF654